MCQSQSVGSYEQAGEVSHMELQRGHEDLYRKEPSENSSYDLPRTATLSFWLDQTQMLFCSNRFLQSAQHDAVLCPVDWCHGQCRGPKRQKQTRDVAWLARYKPEFQHLADNGRYYGEQSKAFWWLWLKQNPHVYANEDHWKWWHQGMDKSQPQTAALDRVCS